MRGLRNPLNDACLFPPLWVTLVYFHPPWVTDEYFHPPWVTHMFSWAEML